MTTFKERVYNAWNYEHCFKNETFIFKCFMCAWFCARLFIIGVVGPLLIVTAGIWALPYYLWHRRKERKHNA